MNRWWGALLVVAAAGTLGACEYVIGLDRPKPIDRPDGPADPCRHARPPVKSGDDDKLTAVPPFWLAVDSFAFLDERDGGTSGFDIDDACTCSADLRDGAAPCTTASATACDADGGVDNELGAVLSRTRQVFDPAAYLGKDIARGRRTLLVEVTQYNGKANDEDVTVSIVQADGIYTDRGCDDVPRTVPRAEPCQPDVDDGDGRCRDGGVFPPLWDDCDRWHAKAGSLSFTGGRRSPTPVSRNPAYVAGHRLVSSYRVLTVFGPGQDIVLEDAVLVGTLSPVGSTGRFALTNGLVVGRAPLLTIARGIGQTLTAPETPLCRTPFWEATKELMCTSLDTMASRSQDFTGARCDAFAFGFGFQARPAELDDVARMPYEDALGPECLIPDGVEAFCN